jgi:hypothetical protein
MDVRAAQRTGELLYEMEKNGQQAAVKDGASSRQGRIDKPTLSDLGITKDQSSDWQKLAEGRRYCVFFQSVNSKFRQCLM